MNPNDKIAVPVVFSRVTPFRAVADDSDIVIVQPGQVLAPYPTFKVAFGKYNPEVPMVPGKPAIPQRSGPNLPDYVAAVPATPDIPAIPSSFTPHREESLALTQDEWDSWDKSVSDNDYILSLVAKRFGVTLTKS